MAFNIQAIFDILTMPVSIAGRATTAAIESLKVRARAWAKEVVALYHMPVPESLAAEKRALLSRANTIRKIIESIFGQMEEFKNVQLGAVPVVAAAVVVGVVGAMTYWLTDFGKFKLEVQRQANANKYVQELVAAGVPIDVARSTVARDESKSFFERIIGDPQKIILPAVGLSIAGFLIYKYFLNKR